MVNLGLEVDPVGRSLSMDPGPRAQGQGQGPGGILNWMVIVIREVWGSMRIFEV